MTLSPAFSPSQKDRLHLSNELGILSWSECWSADLTTRSLREEEVGQVGFVPGCPVWESHTHSPPQSEKGVNELLIRGQAHRTKRG